MTTRTAAPVRTGAGARWRIAARLARRQLRRNIGSSILIVVLILLPIAGLTGYAVVAASLASEPSERVAVELGETSAWIRAVGAPDAGLWQAPSDPEWYGYEIAGTDRTQDEPVDDPRALLPAGTEAIGVVETQTRVTTSDGITAIRAWSGETWDPRFSGRFDLENGRTPAASDEALVTAATLARLGVGIGDEIDLPSIGRFEIVGVLRAADLADSASGVFLPEGAFVGTTRYYLPDIDLDWDRVQELNEAGVVAFSRAVVLDPPEIDQTSAAYMSDTRWVTIWTMLVLLAAGGLFAGYVVVMLAGAAFAVAARRQQRSLAVAASVGADAGDLRRVILLQGTLLGTIGGLSGAAVGLGAAAVVMALTSNGSSTQYWGFHVPWPIVLGILVFSVLVGTASAAMPARTVARSDTLGALRGARRPQVPRASRPIWGSVLLLVGIGVTLGCAFLIAGITTTSLPWDSPLRTVPPFGIVIGPILVQLGILLSGRWLLWLTARGLSRLGLGPRIAARDAAANASRTVPAFAAIAATVFIAVFALGQISMTRAETAREWYYSAPVGTLGLTLHSAAALDPEAQDELDTALTSARDLADAAGATSTAVLYGQPEIWSYPSSEAVPEDVVQAVAVKPDRSLLDPAVQDSFRSHGQDPSDPIVVIAPEDLGTALGVRLSESQLRDYRAGAALVADPDFVTDGRIDIAGWTGRDAYDGRMPSNIWITEPDDVEIADPLWRDEIDAIMVELPLQPTAVALSPETAQRLGIDVQPERIIAAFDTAIPVETRDRIRSLADAVGTNDVAVAPSFEDGPPQDGFWMIPILVAVATLVLGASAVALSLARLERRPDDATLAAVGGTGTLRRSVSFWQGLVIAGFGTLAGAAAGILPPIGFAIQSGGTLEIADLPWIPLALLAVGLPVAIAAVSWLIPPRAPDLTRRTVIA